MIYGDGPKQNAPKFYRPYECDHRMVKFVLLMFESSCLHFHFMRLCAQSACLFFPRQFHSMGCTIDFFLL